MIVKPRCKPGFHAWAWPKPLHTFDSRDRLGDDSSIMMSPC